MNWTLASGEKSSATFSQTRNRATRKPSPKSESALKPLTPRHSFFYPRMSFALYGYGKLKCDRASNYPFLCFDKIPTFQISPACKVAIAILELFRVK
jgi:hypothetical protein